MAFIAAFTGVAGAIAVLAGAIVAWRTAGSTNRQTNAQIDREQLERMKDWQEKADTWREKAEKDISDLKEDRDQLQTVNRRLRQDRENDAGRITKLETDKGGLHDYIEDLQVGVIEGRYPPFLPPPPRD